MSNKLHQGAVSAHARAVRLQQPGYLDPETGLFVLTSAYLRRQGRCCGQGCRHCPWPASAQEEAGRPDVPCFPLPNDTQ
ncbi:MAG: DUF5522 domain-containing protein [Myxococcota bacterium]